MTSPPTSASCTGITDFQSLLTPLETAAQHPDGIVLPLSREVGVQTQDEAIAEPGTSEGLSPERPLVIRSCSWRSGFLVPALMAFGGLLAAMLALGQVLRPRELAEEMVLTDTAHSPLVHQEPASGVRAGPVVSAVVAAEAEAVNRGVSTDKSDSSSSGTSSTRLKRHLAAGGQQGS